MISLVIGYWIVIKYNKILVMIEYPNVNNFIKVFMIGMFILLYLLFIYGSQYEVTIGIISEKIIEYLPLKKYSIMKMSLITLIVSLGNI